MNKKGLLKIVDLELKNRNSVSKETDRNIILDLYRKLQNQNLSYDEILRRMISEFKDFDEDYWKHKIERVLFSEGVADKKSDDENEIEKSLKLTKDEYKELLKSKDYSGIPLPDKYYKEQKSGNGFCQWHLRGLEPEEVKEWKGGKWSFTKLIEGHSLHEDIRLTLPSLTKMVQYVVVESNIESYIRMMKGELNPEQRGIKNVQKAKIISKPSGEPPKVELKEMKDMLIDEKGAKLIDKYIIHKQSYIIPAGQVGATKDKDAYMGLVWMGNVSEGVQREDFHEYFFYPDTKMPDLNKKMMDGKFVIRCFKGNERPASWVIWKATKNSLPLNSWCYIDKGFHYLIPADKVKNFGHESYSEWGSRSKEC